MLQSSLQGRKISQRLVAAAFSLSHLIQKQFKQPAHRPAALRPLDDVDQIQHVALSSTVAPYDQFPVRLQVDHPARYRCAFVKQDAAGDGFGERVIIGFPI